MRSAGYRGAHPDAEDCVWLPVDDDPDKHVALLKMISDGPFGRLSQVAAVVLHAAGRIYFYRGRTISADEFYAIRQPYYRAELECTLIPEYVSSCLDYGLDLARLGASDDNTGSFANLYLVKSWLSGCAMHHPLCHQYTPAVSELPKRVLDLSGGMTDSIRLCMSIQGEKGRYIALSHRWGQTNPLTTTTSSITERLAGITLTSLSQTFREAIYVARIFGIRYLWIDSLCILQDSKRDWEEQAAVMGSIYRQAFITIAAIDAEDSTSGLFFARDAAEMKPCKLNLPVKNDMFAGEHGALYATSPAHKFGTDISRPRGPLDTRAWVLQEQILPGRALNFMRQQVYFECVSSKGSETMPVWPSNRTDEDTDYVSTLKRGIAKSLSTDQLESGLQLHRAWYLMVEDYSRRSLTVQTDRWPAILGVITELERATRDECCYGLWKRWLPYDLLWGVYSVSYPQTRKRTNGFPRGPNGKRNRGIKAPSWSWLQIDGHVIYLTDYYEDVLKYRVLVDIELSTPKSPGEDDDERNPWSLRIRGPRKNGIPVLRDQDDNKKQSEGISQIAMDAHTATTKDPYGLFEEPDLEAAARDPSDDRGTRTWRIASDLEAGIFGLPLSEAGDEAVIGTIPGRRLNRIVHSFTVKHKPDVDRYTAGLVFPFSENVIDTFLTDAYLNKYLVVTVQSKAPVGYWAPDEEGEVDAPPLDELRDSMSEGIEEHALQFLGICRGEGWVRCLGLKSASEDVDAMIVKEWVRVGVAWIQEEAWDAMGGMDGEITLL